MKKSILYLIAAGLVGMLLLSACQAADPVVVSASVPSQTPSPIPLPTDAALEATSTPAPLITPSATPSVSTDPAVKTVKDYFSALQNQDYKAAADLYSTFSLTVDGLTPGDGGDELHTQMQAGTAWSGLQVKEAQPFTDHTILVHVTYTLTSLDVKTGKSVDTLKDELWPVRFENNQWLYNRNNLIDFRTLSMSDQSTAGLNIKPLQLQRYSDRMRLTMMVQNKTNDPIVLGQANEIMAALVFKDKQVEAEKQQLIFQRLRTYSKVSIDVKGLFSAYPDGAIIRQWKNLQVAPWFTFRFSE